MKMRILIVEQCSPNHFSLIESWIRVLKTDPRIVITLCVSEKPLRNIHSDVLSKVESVEKLPDSNLSRFNKIYTLTRDADFVIYNSIQTNFYYFAILSILCNAKQILCIHNTLAWSGKNCGPILKRYVKRFARYVISTQVDVYSVCSDKISRNFDTRGKEKIVIPFQLKRARNSTVSIDENVFVVVYPGIVSQVRKNYIDIISVFKELGEDFKLYLLGAPNLDEGGLEVLRSCEGLDNIVTYQEYVSAEHFDEIMSSADLIVGDLGDCIFRRYDYREIYGVSKDSGISHLMAAYNLPAVLNKEYADNLFDGEIKVCGFTGPADLAEKLISCRKQSKDQTGWYSVSDCSHSNEEENLYKRISHVFK